MKLFLSLFNRNFLGNKTAAQTTGAQFNGSGCTVNFSLYFDDIRFPYAAGMVISFTNLISGHRPFSATVTYTGHIYHLSTGIFPISLKSISKKKDSVNSISTIYKSRYNFQIKNRVIFFRVPSAFFWNRKLFSLLSRKEWPGMSQIRRFSSR